MKIHIIDSTEMRVSTGDGHLYISGACHQGDT
jgi:hypothetical protein